jgi:hypothetical protein
MGREVLVLEPLGHQELQADFVLDFEFFEAIHSSHSGSASKTEAT